MAIALLAVLDVVLWGRLLYAGAAGLAGVRQRTGSTSPDQAHYYLTVPSIVIVFVLALCAVAYFRQARGYAAALLTLPLLGWPIYLILSNGAP